MKGRGGDKSRADPLGGSGDLDRARGPRGPREAFGGVFSASIASGALVAQMVAGKATRDTLFLTHFGIKLLPAAMIGAALVSSFSVVAMSRALSRYGPARVVPATFALGAVFFLGEWWLSLQSEHAAAIAVYLHTAIFGSALGSAFWSLVNERFDPHAAKRLVGRIASGGTIGGIVGGILVWRASAHLSVPMMLALLAGMNVIGLWGALRTAPRQPRAGRAPPPSDEVVTAGGLRVLRGTPYLRDLALLVLAGSIIQALLDWLLSAQATAVYGQGAQLLGFFALFNMIVGVLSFAAQTALTRPILEKRGLGGTMKLQPASIAAGVVLALVMPTFAAVLVLRGIEAVTRNSFYRSAYELFYTPLPNFKKRATKTLIDVGVDRLGTALGSIALLGVAHLSSPTNQTRVVLFGVLGTAAAGWWVASRLQDGYVSALAASLKSGAVALDAEEPQDLTTKKTLAETTALLDREKLLARIEQFQRQKEAKASDKSFAGGITASPSSGKLREAAPYRVAVDPNDPMLARIATLRSGDASAIKRDLTTPLTPLLAPVAVPLLANDAVVRDAVRALRKIGPKVTGMLLDHLLDAELDPRIRRRIPRVLKVCRTQRAADGMLLALRDPIFEVRVQVALALSQLAEETHLVVDREAVFDVTLHELVAGRPTWTETGGPRSSEAEQPTSSADEASLSADGLRASQREELHRGLAHVFNVLGLALEREPLSIAYRALRSEDAALRGTAFEYLEVVLPPRVRDVIVPLLGDVKPAAKAPQRAEPRNTKELADELLRSSASLPRPSR